MSHARFHGEARHSYKEAVLRWATESLSAVKPGTAKRYLVSAGQLDPYFGKLFLDQIDRRRVAGFISGRKKDGATNATIRRDLTALSRILSACVAWGWRDDNPARDFDRSVIRERRDPIRPPTDEEVAALIARCPPMLGRMVAFLAQTGMRQEEAAGLEWSQVDPRDGTVTLLRTKTNRPRVIKISDDAAGTLAGTPRYLGCPYVFWHGQGERYRNVSSQLRAVMKAAKLRFRCHDLRHRFAIDWLRGGGDIYRLARHLGHASVKTTEVYLRYLHEGPAQMPAQVQRFGAVAGSAETTANPLIGGGDGIRTHDTALGPYNGLANPRRPR